MARILVIDDDTAIVDLLRTHFEEWGHKVFTAMDAYGALTLATKEKPELITLDFQLPAGDGAKVYERLRNNTFTAQVGIIFISGRSREDQEEAIPQDPAVRFLPKPIDVPTLKLYAQELLGEAPPASAPVKEKPLFDGSLTDD